MGTPEILIVEDDSGIREVLADALAMEGFTVFQAENGAEGLEVLETMNNPKLVFVDFRMPVMDGKQFCTHLIDTKFASIPVIVMSADREVEKNFQDWEFKQFLRKPFDLNSAVELAGEYTA
jgi:CheY-like chemotaxis protein